MIKAKDPRLRRISVAYEGFIVPQGVPLPRYAQLMEPLSVASLAEVAPSSLPVYGSLVVYYSLGFTAYKAASGGVLLRCGTPRTLREAC